LGLKGEPRKGDRVICLKNNRHISPPIFNGLIGTLDSLIESQHNKNLYFSKINLDGNEIPFYGDISKDCFNNRSPDLYTGKKKDKIGYFDYGFTVTVHRAQGSEFKNVLVIEQECDLWEHKRWLYTAVSRSNKNLIILK
jgi:exodeoxyribonuclease-5